MTASRNTKNRPLLLFDGDCGFCKRWVELCRAWTGERLQFEASQNWDENKPKIDPQVFNDTVVFIDEQNQCSYRAEAIFRALALSPGHGILLWLYRYLPGFAAFSNWAYRRVAHNRLFFSRWLRWGISPSPASINYYIARRVFLFLLGAIYLIAFSSLALQITGLIGSQGILPVENFLTWLTKRNVDFFSLPTLFWWQHSDFFLQFICWTGAACGLAILLGWGGPALTALAWFLYLSLYGVGQVFLGFQWDILLLETGFLAIFITPRSWRPSNSLETRPSTIVLWLLRLLLLRLMFLSGIVKLQSGDPSWKDLTALQYHYFTQPIPNTISYWFHHLPAWFHRESAFFMYVIELGLPWLILFPNPFRFIAALGIIFLQVLIILTGNYGFFNFLTLALAVLLIADRYWPKFFRRKILKLSYGARHLGNRLWPRAWFWPIAVLILLMSVMSTWNRLDRQWTPPSWYLSFSRHLAPLHLVHNYGLFANMTKSRPEIQIEGSLDGKNWKVYHFKYKPGAIDRRPPILLVYMPRLDWQMWFAALRPPGRNPVWFQNLLLRLLEASPDVLALLEENPFPEQEPNFIRAKVSNYYFTDPKVKAETNEWWVRGESREYFPVIAAPGSKGL